MLHKRSTLGTNEFPDTTIRAVESRDACRPLGVMGAGSNCTMGKQCFREHELDDLGCALRVEDNEVMIHFFGLHFFVTCWPAYSKFRSPCRARLCPSKCVNRHPPRIGRHLCVLHCIRKLSWSLFHERLDTLGIVPAITVSISQRCPRNKQELTATQTTHK